MIENNGVKMEVRENLGRVLVAVEDFNNLFDVVIKEYPALVWESGKSKQSILSFDKFLDAYSEAPIDLKNNILQLYHPPLDESSSLVTSLMPMAKQLSFTRTLSEELILKLLAIIATNAHQYYGCQESSDGDLHKHEQMFEKENQWIKVALYLFASKVQHSCCPNVAYTSRTPDGSLAYKVIQNIKNGEEVSFSYIEELYCTPTHERRKKLLDTKYFWCMCKRCCGPDFCRVAPCPECGELSPCKSSSSESTSFTWQCWKGCSPTMENDTLEKHFNNRLKLMIATMRAETPTEPLYDLIKGVTKNLSPTHYIAIRAWSQLSTLYASKASEKERMIKMSQFLPSSVLELVRRVSELSVKELRQKAALTGLRAVSLLECVANECYGCKPGECRHDPVYESSSKVFHACIDLVDIPSYMYPHGAKQTVQRYLPVLYGQFGDDDKDVKGIERVISLSDFETKYCENCKQKKQKLMVCSRCNLVWYCGKDCQVKHWKSTHKQQCVPFR